MTISGSLAQWRSWTGLPFDADGAVEVPGALSPVVCDTAADHAVYVEPNVGCGTGSDAAPPPRLQGRGGGLHGGLPALSRRAPRER